MNLKKQRTWKSAPQRHTRRRGVAMIYAALGLASFLGVSALVVDLGYLYTRRAQAQRAADAAALAGAQVFLDKNDPVLAIAEARQYSKLNGYDGNAGATITACPSSKDGTCVAVIDAVAFRASVNRREPLFFLPAFAALLGENRTSSQVGATAVAGVTVDIAMPPTTPDGYGQPDGPVNLSMFGPDGYYPNGDAYSVHSLPDGSPNPLFQRQRDGFGQGYDFALKVPDNFTTTEVEIFDPDTYNKNDDPNAAWDNILNKPIRIDEYRNSAGSVGGPADATTTRYRLYWDKGTPDPGDDQLIDEKSFGYDATTDMTWAKTFTFDRSRYPGGNFRINATTTAGASENGFALRAGPPRPIPPAVPGQPAPVQPAFDPYNGTQIEATKRIPINFNYNAATKITLGYVPPAAAGKQITIRKFDTDVGGQSVRYTVEPAQVGPYDGVLAGNAEWVADNYTLPSNYTGGIWSATYRAGQQDTSVWEMSYAGLGTGAPGSIRLIR